MPSDLRDYFLMNSLLARHWITAIGLWLTARHMNCYSCPDLFEWLQLFRFGLRALFWMKSGNSRKQRIHSCLHEGWLWMGKLRSCHWWFDSGYCRPGIAPGGRLRMHEWAGRVWDKRYLYLSSLQWKNDLGACPKGNPSDITLLVERPATIATLGIAPAANHFLCPFFMQSFIHFKVFLIDIDEELARVS